jgi:RNA-binding protein
MNVVGRAMSTFGSRMLILQCDAARLPPLYSDVVDRKMQPVGRIVEIFGNVQAPLAAVFCQGQCTVAPDEKLYTRAPAQPGRHRTVLRKQQ